MAVARQGQGSGSGGSAQALTPAVPFRTSGSVVCVWGGTGGQTERLLRCQEGWAGGTMASAEIREALLCADYLPTAPSPPKNEIDRVSSLA